MSRFLLCLLALAHIAKATPVQLTSDGEPRFPVIISENASADVRELANELIDGLEKITGARFSLQEAQSQDEVGIVLGTENEWQGVMPERNRSISERLIRDEYLLKSEKDRVLLLSRSHHGLRNALWGFFHELGFRQFFPGKNWEIWPRTRDLFVDLDKFEQPSYHTRHISMNIWPENGDDWKRWKERNRMMSGFQLNTGHAYGGIIRNNRAHFEAYPEDIAEHPKRGSANQKLDPSRPSALEVASEHALRRLKLIPTLTLYPWIQAMEERGEKTHPWAVHPTRP